MASVQRTIPAERGAVANLDRNYASRNQCAGDCACIRPDYWSWRETQKGDCVRYTVVCSGILLFNEALLGALLVLLDYVGVNKSAGHAAFLCLHFGNTLLLLATLALTAKGLSSGERSVSGYEATRVDRDRNWTGRSNGDRNDWRVGSVGGHDRSGRIRTVVNAARFFPNESLLSPIETTASDCGSVWPSYILWVVMKLWRKRER